MIVQIHHQKLEQIIFLEVLYLHLFNIADIHIIIYVELIHHLMIKKYLVLNKKVYQEVKIIIIKENN